MGFEITKGRAAGVAVRLFVLALLAAPIGFASAAISEAEIPDLLRPWKSWVLHDHPERFCPVASSDGNKTSCLWPSSLSVSASRARGEFRQNWTLYAPGWVMLPGDEGTWPEDVTANGRQVPVTPRDGLPGTYLEPGEYAIAGTLRFGSRPEFLTIPAHTALVSLSLDGIAVPSPVVTADGKLWFGRASAVASGKDVVDSVKTQVFRKLKDGIPIHIETELRLTVSGRDRELRLGKLLPDSAVPLQFTSSLPARLEPDGRLRVQARAGEWVVKLVARYPEPVSEFGIAKMDEFWPDREIWAFEGDRALRVVSLSGAQTLDPQQTLLPDAWKRFPVYLMTPETRLVLEEHDRGSSGAAGNRLELNRTFWLDFDGKGYTVRDRISGELDGAWRIAMLPGNDLGRVEINGAHQLVTRMPGESGSGVEVRLGTIDLMAVSRIEGATRRLSPIGWDQDVTSLAITLNLPPGWQLLYARGADTAHGSWVAKWDLWDIFLLLVITVSLGRVIGTRWGMLTGLTLILIYHEPNAPRFILLNLAVTFALLKALPSGRFRKLVRGYHYLSLVLMMLIVIPFGVDQAKKGLYPQLERPDLAAPSIFSMKESVGEEAMGKNQASLRAGIFGDDTYSPSRAPRSKQMVQDLGAKIQTGPGEPTWSWNSVSLLWSGPVSHRASGDELRLAFISPPVFRALCFARIFLLAALSALFFLFTLGGDARWPRLKRLGIPGSLGALVVILMVSIAVPAHAGAESDPSPPSQALLDQLAQRLLEPEPGFPDAAAITRGSLAIHGTSAIFRLRIDVAARSAVALPARRDQWMPRTVLVNGRHAPLTLDKSGQLRVALAKGVHDVVLQGSVSGDDLRFPVTTPAHHIEIDADGWRASGVQDGRVPGKSIQLNRQARLFTATARSDRSTVLLPDPIAPFVRVERTLDLGIEWILKTRVARLAPHGAAINLRIPTLAGARTVTPNVKQEAGYVEVVLQPDQEFFEWTSVLEMKDEILLEAPNDLATWAERWTLAVSPIWHFEYEGPAPIKPASDRAGEVDPVWTPWPGERLLVKISQPEAVEGPTRTIEQAQLISKPGKRLTEYELVLNIRASQGGDYIFDLPEGAEIQSLRIDGIDQVRSGRPNEVKIPLNPGSSEIRITWKENIGIASLTSTPRLDLKEPVTNIHLRLHLTDDMWPLFVAGPILGPAVLYWGVLFVIVLIGLGLSRWSALPLVTWEWLLLLIGLSTVNTIGGGMVVLWFVLMALRRSKTAELPPVRFNLRQLGLILLSFVAAAALLGTIPMSLLSSPDMQIVGNNSYGGALNWNQDRSSGVLPAGHAFSLPMWTYRVAMLLWSLWMVFALMKWIRWGWECLGTGGFWKSRTRDGASLAEAKNEID